MKVSKLKSERQRKELEEGYRAQREEDAEINREWEAATLEPPPKKETRWSKAAKSRLRMELAGLAFAVKHGFSPQEYARFVWGKGAVKWMAKEKPTKKEYLQRELDAMKVLFPWMKLKLVEVSPHRVELQFIGGCVGGFGKDRWAVARSLGLDRWDVCRYCGEAFKVWAKQLGLKAAPHPARDDSCKIIAWEWPGEDG